MGKDFKNRTEQLRDRYTLKNSIRGKEEEGGKAGDPTSEESDGLTKNIRKDGTH